MQRSILYILPIIIFHNACPAQTQTLTRLVRPDGVEFNDHSVRPAISGDSTHVAFQSRADNIIDDTEVFSHVYVYSRATGDIVRASVDSSGDPLEDIGAFIPSFGGGGGRTSISYDGSLVAFVARHASFRTQRLSTGIGVVVRDLVEDQTITKPCDYQLEDIWEQCTVSAIEPWISGDGTSVVYARARTANTIWAWTIGSQVVSRLDTRLPTGTGFHRGSASPSASFDAQRSVFSSGEDDLVLNDTNNKNDIFLFDALRGNLERISLDSEGGQSAEPSYSPMISGNGRFVVFLTGPSLVGDTPGGLQVVRKDLQTNDVLRIGNRRPFGLEGSAPCISDDGRFVAYVSSGIRVFDAETGADSFVAPGTDPSISGDGRYVAFQSRDSSLVERDTNNSIDVFLFDRGPSFRDGGANDGSDSGDGGGGLDDGNADDPAAQVVPCGAGSGMAIITAFLFLGLQGMSRRRTITRFSQ